MTGGPFLILLPLLSVLSVGLLGRTRRIGFWGGMLSAVVLTPVGGFLLVLLSGPRRRPQRVRSYGKDRNQASLRD